MEWTHTDSKLPPMQSCNKSSTVMITNGSDIGFAYFDYEKDKWYGGFEEHGKEYLSKNHVIGWKY